MNNKELIEELDALQQRATEAEGCLEELAEIKKDTFVLIKQYFSDDSIYLKMLNEIELPFEDETVSQKKLMEYALQKYLDLGDLMISELKLSLTELKSQSPKVFIVHGTAQEPVRELKTILGNVGINPIILHEQPSEGMTIIEKLEKYSNVGFAFIVLTPDDLGVAREAILKFLKPSLAKQNLSPGQMTKYLKKLGEDTDAVSLHDTFSILKNRARQNVILEFGYFIGRLGRSKVCCLYKGDLELPSDMHGICYLPFNNSVNEVKTTILGELRAANILEP